MKSCAYLKCDNEFTLEYSIGNCERCHQPLLTCPHCGEYNREFARFCRMCGKPIDQSKVERIFYTRKLQKSSSLILNGYRQKRLDFIEADGTVGMPFLTFSGNRVIIITPKGYLYDWDFFSDKELDRRKIPDAQFLVKPLLCRNMLFFASKNTIYLYNLLTHEIKDITLKNDSLSIVSMVEWRESLYGLFIDTRQNTHVFGMINTRSSELDEAKEMDGFHFSPNILQNPDFIFFFSKNAVYLYSKKEGNVNLKTFDDFPKKSLNIGGKLYFMPGMDLLYIPEENNIIRLNIKTGQYSYFIKHLRGVYYVEYTERRMIAADDDGLQIYNYNGKKMIESQTETFTKNLIFNYQPDGMRVVSERLLFTFAAQNQGGGFVIPWMLDEPRLISGIQQIIGSRVPNDIISNIDISRNFIGLITSTNEVFIWQF